jgi:hypothetical protein
MAAGYDLDVTGDVGYFEDLTLGVGESRWWFKWDFDERHWQRISFVPTRRGTVTIVSEWIEHDVRQDKWARRRPWCCGCNSAMTPASQSR